MTTWGFKSRLLARIGAVALLSTFIAGAPAMQATAGAPAAQASATDYPPCTIQGTLADETLTGTDGNDVICTGGGNDIVQAGAGDDVVIAENGGSVDVDLGAGNDIFDGTNGSDAVVDGGAGDDELTGTPGVDELNGDEGDDSLVAGASDDSLNGGLGADDLAGSAGADTISGGDGNDSVDGGTGADTINGDAGDDSLVGGSEGDTVHGGDGNDNVVGDAGPDFLYGEAGTDSIDGGIGDDILVGGDGVDTLQGGFGLNMCDFTTGEPLTETCTYDDNAPVVANFAFDQASYEVGTSDAALNVQFDVADPSGVRYVGGICWGNNTNTYPLNFSVNFDTPSSASFWAEGGVTGSMVGDNKSAHFDLDLSLKLGTKPGTYDCFALATDVLNHNSSWQFQQHLVVTRTGGTFDDNAPVVANFAFDQASYEVGTSDAALNVQFDVADPSGVRYVGGICWGNNTNTYPLNFSVNFDTPSSASFWAEGGVTGSMVGDNKSAHFDLDLSLKLGTKPGTYDCFALATDVLNHNSSWQFESKMNVFRTPAGMPSAPTSLALTQDRPDRGVLSWNPPSDLGKPNLQDYVIQVSEDGNTWTELNDGYLTTTNLPLGNLKADTDYWFRVRGENGGTVGQNIDYMTLNWGQVKVHTLAASVPDAPAGLAVSEVTSSGFKLAWKAANYNGGKTVTDFSVEVSTDGGKTWRSAKTTPSTSVSYTVAGASPGTSYLVRVAAINEVGSSSFLQGSVKTLATLPGGAQNLTISKVSYRTLTLGWSLPISNGGSLITNYKIEFSSNNGGTWTEITHAVTASRSFNVTGLTRDRSYKFRVSAINAVGVGPATESATVTTLVAVPTAPREISVVNITSTSADLSWAEPADNGGATVTYYVVEVSSDKGQTWTQVVKTVASKKKVMLAGFSPGTVYQYRVLALNKVGRGATQEGSFTTLAVLPKAPTNAKVSNITSSGLTLSWSLPASNGGSPITDYLIEMSSDGGGTWKSVPHAASNNLALVVTGLPAGTKRLFRVSTITAVGVSEAFSSTQGVTLGNAPEAPTGLKVTSKTSTTVTITWSQVQVVGGSPVRTFTIEYSTDGGATWMPAKAVFSKATSSTITGFKAGKNYKIRVRALNDVGSSAASNFVSVTTR